MLRFILKSTFFAFLLFSLVGCTSAEYKESIEKGNKALEKKNYEEAVASFNAALEEEPDDEEALKGLQKAKAELEKIKQEEERKRIEEERKAAEAKKKEEEEKRKREEEREKSKEKLNKVIQELIDLSEGQIKDIRPTSGDDWIAVYVEVDNSWHLLTTEEKKYVAEQIGPTIESAIIDTGITDYSDVYFVDQNGNIVASPKIFGGYEIK